MGKRKVIVGVLILIVLLGIGLTVGVMLGNSTSVDSADSVRKITMNPTTAKMQGVFDSYLYVPIAGETYRYEQSSMETKDVTPNEILYEFTENAEPEAVEWKVYSLKEYSGCSVVLAVSDWDFECLYRYSPSKRSDEDALQRAKEEGCVVMEDGDVTYGQQIWLDFVKTTEEGKSASVQVAHYYTLNPERCSQQYYEAYKEDYPVLYVHKLDYDGGSYTVRWSEGDIEYIRSYQYLMHYTGDAPTTSATFDSYSRYVLVDDNTVTWEDLEWGVMSSQSGDYIDFYSVYTDLE